MGFQPMEEEEDHLRKASFFSAAVCGADNECAGQTTTPLLCGADNAKAGFWEKFDMRCYVTVKCCVATMPCRVATNGRRSARCRIATNEGSTACEMSRASRSKERSDVT